PGPVAYHVQSSGFTAAVMFSGFVHVAPSSVLEHKSTSREPGPNADLFLATELVPALRVSSNQTRPVVRSSTGHGLPTVSVPSSTITWSGPQVRPPSVLRRSTTSMSPVSDVPFLRPSANAR